MESVYRIFNGMIYGMIDGKIVGMIVVCVDGICS
jgi:hypothetical protein